MKNSHGFTLIELMIVVVIIGILAAIAIPKFNLTSWRAKEKEADVVLKQITTLQDAYRTQCGVYTETLTLATADNLPCTSLEDVGYQPSLLQYYNTPTVVVTDGTLTITAAPNATTGQGLKTRKYDSATGKITDA